jgi:hypothetical protein
MNLQTLLRSSRPISELGNVIGKFAMNLATALKSDLKSTITLLQRNENDIWYNNFFYYTNGILWSWSLLFRQAFYYIIAGISTPGIYTVISSLSLVGRDIKAYVMRMLHLISSYNRNLSRTIENGYDRYINNIKTSWSVFHWNSRPPPFQFLSYIYPMTCCHLGMTQSLSFISWLWENHYDYNCLIATSYAVLHIIAIMVL